MKTHIKFIKDPNFHIDNVEVRRARLGDEEGVYRIACSVSEGERDSYEGFLIDDYPLDRDYYISMFRDRIEHLTYFYVAIAGDKIIGFSLAYKKEMWLKYNPDWIESISWHPEFDKSLSDSFVIIDKTAVEAEHTGEGIGSLIYKKIIQDMRSNGIDYIFSETVLNPIPNFASLAFRQKQNYILAGTRYEYHKGKIYTDLVYYKKI
ncbi:MAG: GNAT family N-acetyltransferase [Gudongella sp.]|nr:GNAT family N-acetyltransferase [Gudongella sp.]